MDEPGAEDLPPELDENTPVVWPTDPEMDSEMVQDEDDDKPSTSDDKTYSYWFGGHMDDGNHADEDQDTEIEESEAEEFEEQQLKPASRKSRQKNESDDDPDWTEENDGMVMPKKRKRKQEPVKTLGGAKLDDTDLGKPIARFRYQWTDVFKWLHFNAVAKVMFCKICRQAGKTGEFATLGCSNFDKGSLHAHDISKEHTEAECQVKNMNQDQLDDISQDASLVPETADDLKEGDMDSQNTLYSEAALLVALRTAYYAAQNQGDKSPTLVYKSMMTLQDSCHVSGARELRLGKQPEKTFIVKQSSTSEPSPEYAFGDDESLAEMHDVLARIIQEDLYNKISQCDFVTIVIQENADVDLQPLQMQLVIHARYTHKGHVSVGFLATVIVSGDKPEDAVKEVLQVLQECDIPIQKVFI